MDIGTLSETRVSEPGQQKKLGLKKATCVYPHLPRWQLLDCALVRRRHRQNQDYLRRRWLDGSPPRRLQGEAPNAAPKETPRTDSHLLNSQRTRAPTRLSMTAVHDLLFVKDCAIDAAAEADLQRLRQFLTDYYHGQGGYHAVTAT
ncbi:hypothetical protein SprV_0200878800 [Sparganum proliferum]